MKTRQTLKQDLLQKVAALGQRALEKQEFRSAEKSELDAIVQELETLNPTLSPLASENQARLLGNWTLIYASNGTVVTRRLAGGITINAIWQTLTPPDAAAISAGNSEKIAVTNGMELELPLLGKLQLQAQGLWQWQGDTQTATVAFDAFTLQPTGLFYQPWQIPALQIPVLEWLRREATWQTSYLDADLRIGCGATGNRFVFVRSSE